MFVCLFLTGSPAIFNFWGDSADQGVALFERRGRDSREHWVKQSLPHKRPAKLLLFFGLCKFFRYFYFVICIFSQFLCIFSFFACSWGLGHRRFSPSPVLSPRSCRLFPRPVLLFDLLGVSANFNLWGERRQELLCRFSRAVSNVAISLPNAKPCP